MARQIRGLYAAKDLPIWAAQILMWLQFEATVRITDDLLMKRAKEYDGKSRWHKFWYSRPITHAPRVFRDNPFRRPSAADLEKFEQTYPDMAGEWRR